MIKRLKNENRNFFKVKRLSALQNYNLIESVLPVIIVLLTKFLKVDWYYHYIIYFLTSSFHFSISLWTISTSCLLTYFLMILKNS